MSAHSYALCAIALVLAGCGASEKVARFAESARDVAAAAEPCLAAAHDVAVQQCSADPACLDAVRSAFAPVADALDAFHELWCEVSPDSEGCP